MDYGSIIAGLINTGIQLWGANEEKGSLNKAADAIQAAPYIPVDYTQVQKDTVKGDIKNLPEIESLDSQTNQFITQQDLLRAKRLIPNYTHAMQLEGNAAQSLLSGQLPFDDALGIVSDSSALAGALGTPGGSAGVTLKDLGLGRLDAIKAGGGMLGDMVNIAGQISPVSRYATPQDMFLTPSQTVPWELEQHQSEWQSAQNQLNAAAQRAQLHAAASNLPWNALMSSSNTAVAGYLGGSKGGADRGGSGGSGSSPFGGGSYMNGMTA